MLEGDLIRKLDEMLRKGIAIDVLAAKLALDQLFNAKDEGCFIRVRAWTLRRKEMKVVR